jgi:2-polyprenyl-6-methoxyphenol hydroxylase-like FAD-dependent oxidoreductase
MDSYDAVVIGARCAGSATAMLMARAGMRVLLLDRIDRGRDTLSTHALMRAAVLQLDRWRLLPRIVAAGTPPITATTFHYGDLVDTVDLAAPLYAPRRTVLDAVLFGAAQQDGVHCCVGAEVTDVSRDDGGRVRGVTARFRGTGSERFAAPIVVGADGLRSTLARFVEAAAVYRGRAASAIVYGYWPRPDATGYDWFYRPGVSAGIIPTNDGEACVWVGLPAARFAVERRLGLEELFVRVLGEAAPEAAGAFPARSRRGRLRGFPGVPAVLRHATGAGLGARR